MNSTFLFSARITLGVYFHVWTLRLVPALRSLKIVQSHKYLSLEVPEGSQNVRRIDKVFIPSSVTLLTAGCPWRIAPHSGDRPRPGPAPVAADPVRSPWAQSPAPSPTHQQQRRVVTRFINITDPTYLSGYGCRLSNRIPYTGCQKRPDFRKSMQQEELSDKMCMCILFF